METEITPLSPGMIAPDFTLPDVLGGEDFTLEAYRGKLIVLNYWSPECPWSNYYDPYWAERILLWEESGIVTVQINSNNNESVDELIHMAHKVSMPCPVLRDEKNIVADLYGATNTPHIFIIDAERVIAYQGAVDDRSFRQQEPTINYLDRALDALLRGQPAEPNSIPAYGCTIVRSF